MEIVSKRRSIKTYLLGIVFLSTLLITIALGYLSFQFSKNRLLHMLGDSGKGIATTAANFIKDEDILIFYANMDKIKENRAKPSAFTSPAVYEKAFEEIRAKRLSPISASFMQGRDENKEKLKNGSSASIDSVMDLYINYINLLLNVKEANRIESPINVYVKDDNRLKLVLSSDAGVPIGAKYIIRPEAGLALLTKIPQSSGIYKDKDGIWISAFAPIPFSSAIFTQGLVEINYKIDLYINKLRRELAMIVLVCLLGFFVTAVLGYKLINRLVATVKRLEEAAVNLENERYGTPIDIKSEDEIGHLAQAFEKLRLTLRKKIEELKVSLIQEKRAHLESIIALGNAIDLRDPYTRRHLYRVDKYALLIARVLKLPRSEIEKLRYGCYLHDIGKLYIEDILLKKTKLTEAEMNEIKKHPENGAKIVASIPFLKYALDIIMYHQEHYDGTGYPKGLKGKAIPFLARIVAVADAFDAMTTDRPYKPRISFKEAMDRIKEDSGIQFDPDVCRAFLEYRNSIERIAKKHF